MPHHLIAAATAHTWSRQWTGAATSLSSVFYFWFGMLNVTLLAVFFSVGAKRRDLRAHDLRQEAATEHHANGASSEGKDTGSAAGAGEPDEARRLGQLLLSDAERDRATDLVCHAIAEGRLGLDEGVTRVDKVLGAQRRATLEPLLADLPDEPTSSDAATTTAGVGVLVLRVAAAALIAGAVLLQALAGVWALWPVAVAALAPLAFAPRRARETTRRRPASRARAIGR